MSNYTPGPWQAEFNEDALRWTVRAPLGENDPHPRSAVSSEWDEPRKTFELCRLSGNRPNAEADARLIVAAPEMKDLLWDAWQDLNALSNGDQSCDARYEATETMEKIMSLLRRIEGEEETE